MFDVGGGELLLIVLAVLVLFGPKKIPEVAAMIGKGMRKVRQAQDDFTQHMRDLSTDLEGVGEKSPASGSVVQSLAPAISSHSFADAEVVPSPSVSENNSIDVATTNSQTTVDAVAHDSGASELSSFTEHAAQSDVPQEDVQQATAPSIRIQPSPGSVSR